MYVLFGLLLHLYVTKSGRNIPFCFKSDTDASLPSASLPGYLCLSLLRPKKSPRMEGGRRAEAESSSAAARAPSESSDDLAEEAKAKFGIRDDEDDGDNEVGRDEGEEPGADGFVPSPLILLRDQVEKDKEDESLRRWKAKLLGSVDGELNSQEFFNNIFFSRLFGDLSWLMNLALCLISAGKVEPEVTFHSIGVVSEGFANLITSLPVAKNQSQILFTLKEGSKYRLRMTFTVRHNIVSGLTYSNVVWKRGIKVDQIKGMLGTFAPQQDPYEHLLEEETTPSGVLARGIYSAKLKFEDDDKTCHLELSYSFEIKKH
ncbi:rho GDP-dissociation inhibitor [Musa troglodytarum]|uniref:Rho GDP-dissociation inhibitor n=1 Tax=Musa troglodytarum TaxID=320322 RepID=A0A9E7G895_9LILI|nr:rho GDP-dissociation inhibitor [Musa troglodytarum]